ncbi:MAG: GYF domain-containing protein, partial [bacterium]
MADWYYTKDGQQHGPVSEDELISIFRNNELDADALVWTEELTEWTAARNIENLIPEKPPEAIKPKFKITGVSHPSAASGGTKSCPSCGAAAKSDAVLCTMCGLNFLSGRKTVPAPIEMRDGIAGRRSNDNGVGLRINVPIWLMIAVPVVGAIIEYFSKLDLPWMFYFLAYAVPCLIDQRLLKKSGNDAPGSAWVFLVPVYLWKRTTLLSYRGRLHFWAWISSFLLAIGVGYYADQVSQVDKTEKTAGSLVTDILSEQLGADAKCVNVRLGKKDTNGVFTAVAKLTDGNTADITVEVKGDQVEVNVEIIRYLVFLKQTAA